MRPCIGQKQKRCRAVLAFLREGGLRGNKRIRRRGRDHWVDFPVERKKGGRLVNKAESVPFFL